jgi:hypothetical protein
MILIEVMDSNSQALEVILDDELFYIVLNWNSTNENWTMDIRNSAYQELIYGVSLVPNYPLLQQFRYSQLPIGQLFVGTAKDRNGPIPRDGFISGNYELTYMTRDEVIAINVI